MHHVQRVGVVNVAGPRHKLVTLLGLAGGVRSLGGGALCRPWSCRGGEVVTAVNISTSLLARTRDAVGAGLEGVAFPEEEADRPVSYGGVPGEGVALSSEGAGVLTSSHTQVVSHLDGVVLSDVAGRRAEHVAVSSGRHFSRPAGRAARHSAGGGGALVSEADLNILSIPWAGDTAITGLLLVTVTEEQAERGILMAGIVVPGEPAALWRALASSLAVSY